MENNYRLVTKSNIDGIISAILLHHLTMISDVTFVRKEDIQKGEITLTSNDILVNLPCSRDVHLAFDYHDNSTVSEFILNENHIVDTTLHSASDVIFSHYHDKFQDNDSLKSLVQMATNETHHTLTTKDRLYVYSQYENIFDTPLVEA